MNLSLGTEMVRRRDWVGLSVIFMFVDLIKTLTDTLQRVKGAAHSAVKISEMCLLHFT